MRETAVFSVTCPCGVLLEVPCTVRVALCHCGRIHDFTHATPTRAAAPAPARPDPPTISDLENLK